MLCFLCGGDFDEGDSPVNGIYLCMGAEEFRTHPAYYHRGCLKHFNMEVPDVQGEGTNKDH
jgi:hypothetical protein